MTPHAKHTHSAARAVPALLTLLAAVITALALSGAATAAASSKCGEQVLADWFDNGRIDRLYPLHCYEEAIDAIPNDIRDYADAEEVISRALQAALSGNLAEGGCDPTPEKGSKNPCTGSNGSGGSGGGSGGTGGSNGSGSSGSGSSGSGSEGSGSGSEAAPNVDASGPSSIPIPLVILGGMSLALLAAGGLGYLSRRRQAARALDDSSDDPTLV
ncbi:MAG TPA: hypothetical protein VIG93_03580 [Gaiellaceae bacterium]